MKVLKILALLLGFIAYPQQITSFNPTISAAGIGDVLTINGNGFGTMDANDRVYIGSIYAVPTADIISWTNTQIVTKIHSNARPGTIRVLNDGVEIESNNSITIRYGIYNAYNQVTDSYQVPKRKEQYVFKVHGFSSNGLSRLQTAIEIWGCATGYNFDYEVSDVDYGLNDDNISSIYVAEGPGGAGTLQRWKECGEYTYLNEVDIRFDDATPPLYYIVHELGHAIGLTHNYYDNQSVVRNAGSGPTNPSDIDIEAVAKILELGNIPTACTNPMNYSDCYTLTTGQFNPEDAVVVNETYYDMSGRLIKNINQVSRGIYIVKIEYDNGHIATKKRIL